jgi:hypothetical protein
MGPFFIADDLLSTALWLLLKVASFFFFQDVLHDLTSLQPLTAPPSLIPRPGFIRPLTPGLSATVMATTSNPIAVSTNTFLSSSTATVFTSASSSGTTFTSSTTSYPQVSSVARPIRSFSTRPTIGSPRIQTLLTLKSLIKKRNNMPPPYSSVVRATATYIPPIGSSAVVSNLPLDLSVSSTSATVPSGPRAAPQLPVSLEVEAQPEPTSSTVPHRIPILQRPQSTLATLLTAGSSNRPPPTSTPILEVFYPLYSEVEGNKDGTV